MFKNTFVKLQMVNKTDWYFIVALGYRDILISVSAHLARFAVPGNTHHTGASNRPQNVTMSLLMEWVSRRWAASTPSLTSSQEPDCVASWEMTDSQGPLSNDFSTGLWLAFWSLKVSKQPLQT